MPAWVTWRRARTTSSSSMNCRRGSKPKMDGQTGRDEVPADWRGQMLAEDVGEAEHGDPGAWVVLGEVTHEPVGFDQRALHAVPHRARAGGVLLEGVRVAGGGAVDQGGGLDHDVAHRRAGCSGRSQEVHRPDDVDLVHGPPRHRGGIRDHEGVEDRVDLGRLHDPVHDGVGLVGSDELGALEGDRRRARSPCRGSRPCWDRSRGLGSSGHPRRCRHR